MPAEVVAAELQIIIVAIALAAGALRGALGYWFNAPENESFSKKKLLQTVIRYAFVNLVSVNGMALAGVVWTPLGVLIYTSVQLVTELGFDIRGMLSRP